MRQTWPIFWLAPKGRNLLAQGNALGKKLQAPPTQGVALG